MQKKTARLGTTFLIWELRSTVPFELHANHAGSCCFWGYGSEVRHRATGLAPGARLLIFFSLCVLCACVVCVVCALSLSHIARPRYNPPTSRFLSPNRSRLWASACPWRTTIMRRSLGVSEELRINTRRWLKPFACVVSYRFELHHTHMRMADAFSHINRRDTIRSHSRPFFSKRGISLVHAKGRTLGPNG